MTAGVLRTRYSSEERLRDHDHIIGFELQIWFFPGDHRLVVHAYFGVFSVRTSTFDQDVLRRSVRQATGLGDYREQGDAIVAVEFERPRLSDLPKAEDFD